MVAGEGHGDAVGPLHKRGHYQGLLGGKVGKAVQVNVHAVRPAALPQGGGQTGQLVPGVRPQPGAQSVIGGENKAQVPELVSGGAPQLAPRPGQCLRSRLIALALIQGGQQAGEKGALAGGTAVDGKPLAHLLHRQIHHQKPPAVVQGGRGQPPRLGKDTGSQTGKGEHLRAQRQRVPTQSAHPALRTVGILLRDDKDLPPFPMGGGHAFQDGLRLPRPGPADEYGHHAPASL